jgi:hypothetical protein
MAYIHSISLNFLKFLANDSYYFRSGGRKPMKISRILSVVVIVIFCCTGVAFSDKWKNKSGKERRDKPQYHNRHQDKNERSLQRSHQDDMKRHDSYRHSDQRKRTDYHKHYGYRERPYQKNRRYEHHRHRGHRYAYQGHWRSWKQWDRYAKAHPGMYKHGSYYREDAHLMFRFRDPVSGSFFFFSIGR